MAVGPGWPGWVAAAPGVSPKYPNAKTALRANGWFV